MEKITPFYGETLFLLFRGLWGLICTCLSQKLTFSLASLLLEQVDSFAFSSSPVHLKLLMKGTLPYRVYLDNDLLL